MPRLLEGQAGLLRQAEALAPFPGLASVGRALNGRAVDAVVRGHVEIVLVLDRVEDVPPRQERIVDLPGAAVRAAAQDEEPLPRSDENGQAHGR